MNVTEHLLSILAEECCEVGQCVSKALRFGPHDAQPGQELTNAERIVAEFGDLLAAAEMLEEAGVIIMPSAPELRRRIENKKAKVLKFMGYAREQGALSGQADQEKGHAAE